MSNDQMLLPKGEYSALPIVAPPCFSDEPVTVTCNECSHTVSTTVIKMNGAFSWMMCTLVTFSPCFLCFWVPFCTGKCKDVHHVCPNCNRTLGIKKPL